MIGGALILTGGLLFAFASSRAFSVAIICRIHDRARRGFALLGVALAILAALALQYGLNLLFD